MLVDLNSSNSLVSQRLSNTGFDDLAAKVSASGNTQWYLTDAQGSARQIVDNSANMVGSQTFDAFGVRTSVTGTVDRYAYTGREWDSFTNLQYNRARMYDPSVGRWYSPDPMGFNAGDANLYRNVGNFATGATDPSGLEEHTVTKDHASEWQKYFTASLLGKEYQGPLRHDAGAWSQFHSSIGREVEQVLRDNKYKPQIERVLSSKVEELAILLKQRNAALSDLHDLLGKFQMSDFDVQNALKKTELISKQERIVRLGYELASLASEYRNAFQSAESEAKSKNFLRELHGKKTVTGLMVKQWHKQGYLKEQDGYLVGEWEKLLGEGDNTIKGQGNDMLILRPLGMERITRDKQRISQIDRVALPDWRQADEFVILHNGKAIDANAFINHNTTRIINAASEGAMEATLLTLDALLFMVPVPNFRGATTLDRKVNDPSRINTTAQVKNGR